VTTATTVIGGVERASGSALARPFAWPMVAAVLALYVAAETVFNLNLIDAASAAEPDRARLDDLVIFGKIMGAFGIALFALRPFFARLWRRTRWGLPAIFVVAWIAIYGGLTLAYDRVLDGVPETVKREALLLVVYREAVFAGAIENPELRAPDGATDDAHRLALVNLAARLTGEKPEIALVREKIAEAEAALAMGAELPPALTRALLHARTLDAEKLREATGAIFLPPMSMTVSLLAIVANLAALVGLLLATTARRRRNLRRALGALPMLAVAAFLLAVDRPPYERDNPSYDLYTRLDDRLGFAGWVWSRAINGQAAILRLTYDVPGFDVIARPRPA
jgi:hypothetical protein